MLTMTRLSMFALYSKIRMHFLFKKQTVYQREKMYVLGTEILNIVSKYSPEALLVKISNPET